ncbi:MAG: phosphoribosylanthranilate isomerase [Cyanobium sp.]
MPSPLLKVCGLRDPHQARAVAALGVDAVGVIGVAASPRFVEPARRQALFAAVAEQSQACRRVLVVADPSDQDLPLLDPAAGGHQVLQLHGDETVERCRYIRDHLAEVSIWKALRIRTPADLDLATAYLPVVEALLLDAWVPDQLGGTGHRLPLEWLQGFRASVPWWLAGGITPERVPEVLARVQPDGLDASSGVEDGPGRKNLSRVKDLVEAVRSAGAVPPEPMAPERKACLPLSD